MGKTIKLIRRWTFIIILMQLILLSVFCVFYFANLFELQKHITVEYIVLGACGVLFLEFFFLLAIVFKISALRQKTDLHAAEVIGQDVQAAYNFAMMGLVVVDDKNIVLWTNELFRERNINIIDTNIYEWKPGLRALYETQDDKATINIVENGRTYEVKYLMEAGLFIFKDTTDLELVQKFNKDQAPVVGLLSIDNYNDVVGTEDDFNDSISKVKNVIFAKAKEYGILLRRYRNDTYFILCNHAILEKMKDDNFSIVNQVRQIGTNDDVPLTLSLGLAHNFPDVVKLSDMADEALSIAMSRGGDQVVINKYGEDMEFIGGQTEAQENRNKVKIRVLADSLISLIKSSSNVLIMGHTNMDMDAFGACLGVKAIADTYSKQARIVVDLKKTEHKTRATLTSMFSREELQTLIVSPKDSEPKLANNTLLIVVDVHIPSMTMHPELLDKANKVVVIDHHRRAEKYIESPVFNHIDPSASSTCEIIAEFAHFASISPKVVINPKYATIMMSGIFLDSGNFKSKIVGIRTFEACTFLKEFGADNAKADDLLKDDFEEHMIVNKIVANMQTPYPGVVYAIASQQEIFDDATLAKAANACLDIKSVNAAFVFGKISPKLIKMSLRSDSTINVQILAQKMGGGGHFSKAAVVFEKNDFAAVTEILLNCLSKNLALARNDRNVEEDK